MKKIKKLLMLIPACGLFLSGCSFEEVKHSVSESWVGQHILHPVYDPIKKLINGSDKKEEEKSEQPADSKPADSTPSGGDTTPANTSVSFVDMELRIKPIAAALLGKEESALVSEDYDEADEDSTADYFTHNTDELMFVNVPYESANEEASYKDLLDELKAQLPAGAELDTEKSAESEGYYIDQYYKVDGYYYVLYSCDYYGLGMVIYGNFDIVPQAQYDAYHVKMWGEEGGGEGGETATPETSTDFPLSKVQSALEITDSFPIPSGSSFDYLLDTEYKNSCYVTVHEGDLSAYLDALEGAGFTVYDYIEDASVAYAMLDSFCLEIEVTSNAEYKVNYYIGSSSSED